MPRSAASAGSALRGARPSCVAAAASCAAPAPLHDTAGRPRCAHLPAIALQHDMHAPIAIADPRRDNLMHALTQRRTRIARARLALGRPVLTCQLAGLALAVAVGRRHIGHNLLHERWPGNFFDSTSCSTALSRLSSATSLFSRAFSSTTCLSSRTWSDSSPAYCRFHRYRVGPRTHPHHRDHQPAARSQTPRPSNHEGRRRSNPRLITEPKLQPPTREF